jgi:hypothetical protein
MNLQWHENSLNGKLTVAASAFNLYRYVLEVPPHQSYCGQRIGQFHIVTAYEWKNCFILLDSSALCLPFVSTNRQFMVGLEIANCDSSDSIICLIIVVMQGYVEAPENVQKIYTKVVDFVNVKPSKPNIESNYSNVNLNIHSPLSFSFFTHETDINQAQRATQAMR